MAEFESKPKAAGAPHLHEHPSSRTLGVSGQEVERPRWRSEASSEHTHPIGNLVPDLPLGPTLVAELERSYPSHMVQQVKWEGRQITVRPIHPDDETQHLEFLGAMEPADIRMRIFHSRSSISNAQLQRLTRIDYQREMAFVAVEDCEGGCQRTLGVARAILDADTGHAEFGILVRSALKGQRLGELLMRRLIEHERERDTEKLVATVLAQNSRMLEMARRLGFVETPCDEGDGILCIELEL